MAASTQEQTANTTIVLEASQEIKDMAQKFSEDGTELNQQGQILKDMAQLLGEQINHFTV